jgi:hypothetical protein
MLNKAFAIAFIGLFVQSTAFAAIAYDNKASSSNTSSASLTYSHTVAGSDRILFVWASGHYTSGAAYPTSVTYNGTNMTELTDTRQDYVNARSSVWYLIAPDTGTNDVVITFAASKDSIIGLSLSYTGADQASQPDAQNSQNGQEASDGIADTSITTTVDGCGIVTFANGNQNWGAWTVVSPFTDRSSANAAANHQAYSADYIVKATAGAQEVDWTVVNLENWSVFNVSFDPAATSTGQVIIVS